MLYRRRLRHPPNTFGQPGKAHKARRTEPRRRGRSTPLLHSWFVQRGDGLILRTLSPNFALTPKLQHYRHAGMVIEKSPVAPHRAELNSEPQPARLAPATPRLLSVLGPERPIAASERQ